MRPPLLPYHTYIRTDSRSAFLLYLNVKLVPFFAFVLEGRSISKATWISAFLAFAGTVLLSSDGTPPNVGDLWSVLAASTSAMFILRLEKYSGSCDASRLNSANLWITAGLCGVWAGRRSPPCRPAYSTLREVCRGCVVSVVRCAATVAICEVPVRYYVTLLGPRYRVVT